MLVRLEAAGIPAAISHSAGTFVCNQVFFGLMRLLARRHNVRGGFVHVPYLPEQTAQHSSAPSLPLDTMIAAVRLGLDTALTTRDDLHYAAGSTH
jgi:pyroglutamyl-peptidase